MGFGWLLIGYFFANMMSLYSPLSFAMLVGYPMMIIGLYHLAHYHVKFQYCWYLSFASLPLAVYFALYSFSQFGLGLDWAMLAGTFFQTMEWVYFAFSLAFHGMLLYAIAGLSGELKLIALQGNAYRNLIMVGLYYAIDLVARLPISFIRQHQAYFSFPLILLRLLFLLLNMLLIFKCHRYICPEGDEYMPVSLKKDAKSYDSDEDEDEEVQDEA